MLELDNRVRIEEAVATKTAVATEELLSDEQTAPHYFAPRKISTKDPVTGATTETTEYSTDAVGNRIVLGKSFVYRDYKAPRVQRVYVKASRNVVVDGETIKQEYWKIDSDQPTQEAALQRATELLMS